MFNDVADKVFIDQAFSLLAGIHQTLFTDPVDPAGDPGGFLIDIIQRFIRVDVPPAAGISQMGLDVLFCLRTVQVGRTQLISILCRTAAYRCIRSLSHSSICPTRTSAIGLMEPKR